MNLGILIIIIIAVNFIITFSITTLMGWDIFGLEWWLDFCIVAFFLWGLEFIGVVTISVIIEAFKIPLGG